MIEIYVLQQIHILLLRCMSYNESIKEYDSLNFKLTLVLHEQYLIALQVCMGGGEGFLMASTQWNFNCFFV